MILISACLLGIRCRYDGQSRECPDLLNSLDADAILPVCPEQLGGLSTPREAASLTRGGSPLILQGRARVLTLSGVDVTENYLAGVEAVLKILSMVDVEKAVLKEKSPSCGIHSTYVDGALTPGMRGLLAEALAQVGVPLVSDKDLTTS
jgi:uncharacterized protein YbbK (DUF523 family)